MIAHPLSLEQIKIEGHILENMKKQKKKQKKSLQCIQQQARFIKMIEDLLVQIQIMNYKKISIKVGVGIARQVNLKAIEMILALKEQSRTMEGFSRTVLKGPL